MANLARRRLFTRKEDKPLQLLPWIKDAQVFFDQCSRCESCVSRCPEKIIIKGEAGFPTIDFNRGECTFCYQCAEVCDEPLFLPQSQTPWTLNVKVASSCLAIQGVTCRSCEDHCETEAISFTPRLGGPAIPQIDSDLCNGCGACLSPCANNSLNMIANEEPSHGN